MTDNIQTFSNQKTKRTAVVDARLFDVFLTLTYDDKRKDCFAQSHHQGDGMMQMISLSIRQLQSHYVRRLANQCYVRYWINWDGKNGSRMALRCLDQNGEQVHVPDLLKAGFLLEERDGSKYYVCERSERPGNWESRETVSLDIALTSTSPELCACCDNNDSLFAGIPGILMSGNGVVERCDACERFASDEEARQAFARR